MKLSVCMIVRDEEKVLGRCLDSIGTAAEEIVIVDTGSKDDTLTVARRYTDSIYSFPWRDDFAAARNYSFEKARGDYLMWLDADDLIGADMVPLLKALKQRIEEENADMVVCKYVNGSCSYFRERIVRASGQWRWEGRVHECITPHGKIISDDFTVTHLGSDKPRGTRNLHIYQKWRAEEPLGARDLFYYGRELFYNRLYTEAEAVLNEMLAGDGWHVNKIEACKVLSSCLEARGRRQDAELALFRSFAYGPPRGGVCNELGRIFREQERHADAIYWYNAALNCPDFSSEGDFDDVNARTLYPLLGLVCSYWALGERDHAMQCHRRAALLAPDHPAVAHNAAFFRKEHLLTET